MRNDKHGDIIAIGNAREGSISVFHKVPGRGSSSGRISPQVEDEHSSQNNTMRAVAIGSEPLCISSMSTRLKSLARHSDLEARFTSPPLIWLDHPLSSLYAYAPNESLCGVAILPSCH
jgi:hypothetical protein